MLLEKIKAGLATYGNWLTTTRNHPRLHHWESQQVFQDQWNLDTTDPAAMFDASLQNSETRRLWQTENWYPKKMMLEFWKFDPMTTRMMFDDLFNETRDIEGRVRRFVFGCDTLLADFKAAHPTSIENNHYHSDYRMIALYLTYRYPDTYAPYDLPVFQNALLALGARDIPQENDPGRFFKVVRTLNQFIEKEPAIREAMQRHLNPKKHFQGKTLLLAADFCWSLA